MRWVSGGRFAALTTNRSGSSDSSSTQTDLSTVCRSSAPASWRPAAMGMPLRRPKPSCSIRRCDVVDNRGGFRFDNSMPSIDQCRITDNIAPDHYLVGTVEVTAPINQALYAADTDGVQDIESDNENGAGILLMNNSRLSVQNCLIANNDASNAEIGIIFPINSGSFKAYSINTLLAV